MIKWTCSNYSHHEHKYKWIAWLCGKMQWFVSRFMIRFGILLAIILSLFVISSAQDNNWQYISTQDFSGGLNLSLSPSQIAPNQAQVLENALWDKQGSINLRNGFVKMNSTKIAGKPIRGLYRYYLPDGTKQTLVACSTVVWKDSAGTFVNALIYKGGQVIVTDDSRIIRGIGTHFYQHCSSGDTMWFVWSPNRFREIQSVCNDEKILLKSKWNYTTDTIDYWVVKHIPDTVDINFSYADGFVYISDGINSPFKYDGSTFWRADIAEMGISHTWALVGSDYFYLYDGGKSWLENEWVGYHLVVGGDTATGSDFGNYGSQSIINWNTEDSLFTERPACGNGGSTVYPLAKQGYFIVSVPTLNSYIDSGTITSIQFYSTPVTFDLISDSGQNFVPLHDLAYDTLYTVGRNLWLTIPAGYNKNFQGLIYKNHPSSSDTSCFIITFPTTNTYDSASTTLIGEKYKLGIKSLPNSEFSILYRDKFLLLKNSLHPSRFWFSKDNWYENFDPLNYKDVETNDGDYITGGTVLGEVLLVFKNNHTFRVSTAGRTDFFGTEAGSITYLEISNRVGCVAPKTAVATPSGAFFLHYSGVYWTDGQQVKLVSNNIKPIIDAIPRLYIHKASAGYYKDHYYISFPDSADTLNTLTYAMNIYNGAWSKFTSLSGISAFSCYASMDAYSDTIGMMMGDVDSGIVYYYDVGNADIDSPIVLTYQSPQFDMQAPNMKKRYDRLVLDVDGDSSFVVQYFYDYNDTARFTDTLDLSGEQILSIYPNANVLGNNGSWKLTTYRGMTDFKLNKAVWKFKVEGEL